MSLRGLTGSLDCTERELGSKEAKRFRDRKQVVFIEELFIDSALLGKVRRRDNVSS